MFLLPVLTSLLTQPVQPSPTQVSPFITNSTGPVADRIKPEQVFEKPEYSSSCVAWLLDSTPVGSCLDYFEKMISDVANAVVPQKSTHEHRQLMAHYYANLIDKVSVPENLINESDIQNSMSGYLDHAKVLVERRIIPKGKVVEQLSELRQLKVLFEKELAKKGERANRVPKGSGKIENQHNEVSVLGRFFDGDFDLADLDGVNGLQINGINPGDLSGIAVSNAGDVNGDGIDDVIIGARGASLNGLPNVGESYVLFGTRDRFGSVPLDLSGLSGENGFQINGVDAGDGLGRAVSGAGDVNGDGVDDVVVGAPSLSFFGGSGPGKAYVVFGRRDGFMNAPIELSALNGNDGFEISGVDPGDHFGFSVSSAGDLNDDGVDDIIIGAPALSAFGGNGSSGKAYVVFGSRSPSFPVLLNASNLNGVNGFQLNGIDAGDAAGGSVSCAGDMDGDGVDDIVVGAYGADPNGLSNAGESYVVFGNANGFGSKPFELSSLNGNDGFQVNGAFAFDHAGSSVSSAGDFNGDGVNDIIIGAPSLNFFNGSNAGESYVVFGNRGGFGRAPLELSSLNGTNGFQITGASSGFSDDSGFPVSGAGDFNGDGVGDVIIGVYRADPNGLDSAGESYIVFGNRNGFGSSPLDLSSIDGNNGVQINGVDPSDLSGFSVSGAGDFNGDGVDDVIIGAYRADPNGLDSAGESYVVFGQSSSSFLAPSLSLLLLYPLVQLMPHIIGTIGGPVGFSEEKQCADSHDAFSLPAKSFGLFSTTKSANQGSIDTDSVFSEIQSDGSMAVAY